MPDSYSLHLDYNRNEEPRHVEIDLWKSPCHFGGTREWFTCPRCRRRVAIVYLASVPGCRQCLRLRYQSQSNDFLDRSWGRTQKVLRKLGRELEEFPRRKKGMHSTTFERLFDAWCREEQYRDEALTAFMAERHQLFL